MTGTESVCTIGGEIWPSAPGCGAGSLEVSMPVLLEEGALTLGQVDEALVLLVRALPGFDADERELAWVSIDRLLELRFVLEAVDDE